MLKPLLQKIIKGHDLNSDECVQAMRTILTLENPEQISAFLSLMRVKGETSDEMSTFVHVLREMQNPIQLDTSVCDIVGTGGDGANTANISTMASVLAASCGVPILKHGNRAVSSQSGSADVLEALGYRLERSSDEVVHSIRQHNIGFCFAPNFHPALLSLKPLRNRLNIPTLFNLLGPLLNPGKPDFMILGVYEQKLLQLMADILIKLNIKRAMVVHGSGLDELNCLGPCQIIEIHHCNSKHYSLDPLSLGLPRCRVDDLLGGDSLHNAHLFRSVLNGKHSALSDTVILNAAAAVYITERAATLADAISVVKQALEQGEAMRTLSGFLGEYHE